MRGGRKLKMVIPGGSSMPVLPAEIMMATDMDYDSISKAGSMLGSGAVIVMDETRCAVKSLLRLSYFYYEESCGQCTPCREGTGWLWRMVDRIERGEGTMADLDRLTPSVCENIQGRTICALGDAAAMPVQAPCLKHFRAEFEHHIEHKTLPWCPAYVVSESEPWLRSRLDGRQDRGARGQHGDARGCQSARHLHSALLLSQEAQSIAANCRMCLVEVEKAPKPLPACATPVTPGMIVHHQNDKSHQGPKGRDGVFADQPPAGLPHLRPGRRVPAAGPGRGVRRRRLRATQKKSALSFTRTVGPLISMRGDESLHPLHPLRSLRPGNCRRDGAGHVHVAASIPRSSPSWARRSSSPSSRAT